MATIPAPEHTTARAIYALHETQRAAELPRPYLGCSELGEPCARRLWLRFRWVEVEQFEGRMLRLFDTGNREEARVLDELRALGVEVAGEQHEVEFAQGHGKGHMDAAVLGLAEAPKTWHVLDVKTSKAKKYAEVVKKGMGAVYPKYSAQAQMYMGLTGMDRAAFVFVCKDTDDIHVERVEFDKDEFARLKQRALEIVYQVEPPDRISADPEWFECKLCPFHAHCHGTERPMVNCRTCAHSTPIAGGKWNCALHGNEPDVDFQRGGCGEHRYIPILLERVASLVEVDGNRAKWRNTLTDRTFEQPGYDSRELRNAPDWRCVGDEMMTSYKEVFGSGARLAGAPTRAQREQMAMTHEIKDDLLWQP